MRRNRFNVEAGDRLARMQGSECPLVHRGHDGFVAAMGFAQRRAASRGRRQELRIGRFGRWIVQDVR